MGHHAELKSVPQNIYGHAVADLPKTDRANPPIFSH
jgi:hypothetical protein